MKEYDYLGELVARVIAIQVNFCSLYAGIQKNGAAFAGGPGKRTKISPNQTTTISPVATMVISPLVREFMKN